MKHPIRRLLARFYHLRGMTWRHWGHLYDDPAAYRRAERDFTRAIEILPTFAQALYDRGLLRWRELGDGEGAEADLTRVLELDPKRAEAWFNRALAREVMGDLAGAAADFRRYLSEGSDPQWREISRRQIAVLEASGTGGEMSREIEPSSRPLQPLLGLRAALHVYCTALLVLGEQAREPDRRRELLTLWRPCQERLDALIDVLPVESAGPLRLLRQEIEDGLLDDPPSLPAIADALDALEQACEDVLMKIRP